MKVSFYKIKMVFVYKCKLLAIDDNTYREVKLHQGQCLNGCIPSVKINLVHSLSARRTPSLQPARDKCFI